MIHSFILCSISYQWRYLKLIVKQINWFGQAMCDISFTRIPICPAINQVCILYNLLFSLSICIEKCCANFDFSDSFFCLKYCQLQFLLEHHFSWCCTFAILIFLLNELINMVFFSSSITLYFLNCIFIEKLNLQTTVSHSS